MRKLLKEELELENNEEQIIDTKCICLTFKNALDQTATISLNADNYKEASTLIGNIKTELDSNEIAIVDYTADEWIQEDLLLDEYKQLDLDFINLYFEDAILEDKLEFLTENGFQVSLSNIKAINIFKADEATAEFDTIYPFIEEIFSKENGDILTAINAKELLAYFDIDCWFEDFCNSGRLIYQECIDGSFIYEILPKTER